MKSKWIRKVTTMIATTAIVVNMFTPIMARADSEAVSYQEQPLVYQAVMRGVRQVQDIQLNTQKTYYAQLSNLINIEQMCIWLDYFRSNGSIEYPSIVISNISTALSKKIKDYNAAYGVEPQGQEKFIKGTLSEDVSKTEGLQTIVNKDIASITGDIADPLNKKLDNKTVNDIPVEEYGVLSFTYGVLLQSTGTVDYIHGAAGPVSASWSFSTSGLADLFNKYPQVMKLGKAIVGKSFAQGVDNDITDTNILFKRFVRQDPKVKDSFTKDFIVNNAYLSCVAASACYVPLESKVGDPLFMDALKDINHNESVWSTYQQASQYRKPLYVRGYNSMSLSGNPLSGPFKKLTVGDLVDMINNGKGGALYAPVGKVRPGQTTQDDYQVVQSQGNEMKIQIGTLNDPNPQAMTDDEAKTKAGTKGLPNKDPNANSKDPNDSTQYVPINGNPAKGADLSKPGEGTPNTDSKISPADALKAGNGGLVTFGLFNQKLFAPPATMEDYNKALAKQEKLIMDSLKADSGYNTDASKLTGNAKEKYDKAMKKWQDANPKPGGGDSSSSDTKAKDDSKDKKDDSKDKKDSSSQASDEATKKYQDSLKEQEKKVLETLKDEEGYNEDSSKLTGKAKEKFDKAMEEWKKSNPDPSAKKTDDKKDDKATPQNGKQPKPQIVKYEKGGGKEGNNNFYNDDSAPVSLSDTVTDASAFMDKPIFRFDKISPAGGMGFFLINNIFHSGTYYKNKKDLDSQLLFMDAFGDICTNDGTLIMPAAANPTYYKNGKDYFVSTATFGNYYPVLNVASSTSFSVANQNQVGKMVLVAGDAKTYLSKEYVSQKVHGISGVTPLQVLSNGALSADPYLKSCMAMNYALTTPELQTINLMIPTTFSKNGGELVKDSTAEKIKDKVEGVDKDKTVAKDEASDTLIKGLNVFLPNSNLTVNGTSINIFPIQQNNKEGSIFLARQMYNSMLFDNNLNPTDNGGLYDLQLFTHIWARGLNGLTGTEGYVKNSMSSYKSLSNLNISDFTRKMGEGLNSLLDSCGRITGVVGIKSAYQTPGFGTMLYYISAFAGFVIILLIMYFTLVYVRSRKNIVDLIISVVSSILITFIALEIVPIYIPRWYNKMGSGINTKLTYSALMMNQDRFSNPYVKTAKGEGYENGSPSITVYNIPRNYYKTVAQSINVKYDEVFSGNPIGINNQCGFFLQGNQLMYNVNSLLNTYSIIDNASYRGQDGSIATRIEYNKVISSNIDMYCPYSFIMQGFVDNLNNFAEAYKLTPSMVTINTKLSKGAYVVNDFVNSTVFLDPGRVAKEYGTTTASASELIIHKNFPNPEDWLGLENMIASIPKDNASIWYKTLQADGLLEEKNKKELEEILYNVNMKTKRFVVSINKQIPTVTDSTLIKIISLYATCEFDKEISHMGINVYPQVINYQDLSLANVMTSVLTNPESKYVADSDQLTLYITQEYGGFGTVLTIIALVLAWIIVVLTKFLIPILYVLLLILTIIRTTLGKEAIEVLKGYIKVFIIMALCFFVFIWATSIMQTLAGYKLVLIGLIIIYLIILFVLGQIVAVLLSKDIWDLGNSKMNAKLGSLIGFSRHNEERNTRLDNERKERDYSNPYSRYEDRELYGDYIEDLPEEVVERRIKGLRKKKNSDKSYTEINYERDNPFYDFDSFDYDEEDDD